MSPALLRSILRKCLYNQFEAKIEIFTKLMVREGLLITWPSNGDFILRETSVVIDESLESCQVVTVANFGPNEAACLEVIK